MKQKFLDRCAARAADVGTLEDGTLVVPSVAACPNRTVGAWMHYLGLGLNAKIMILSAEPGRCWIKHPGHSSTTAYG